jgi:hypothetical protein
MSSPPYYQSEPPHTVRLGPPTGSALAEPKSVNNAVPAGQWYGPGRLRRAAFNDDDNKQVYALENDSGQLLMYITAKSGMDLTPFLSRAVYVFGNVAYHGTLRNNYMVVGDIRALP